MDFLYVLIINSAIYLSVQLIIIDVIYKHIVVLKLIFPLHSIHISEIIT